MVDLVQVGPFQVPREEEARIRSFVDAMRAAGYEPSAGDSYGYADRNIRGTNTPSKHKIGAIDWNASKNAEGTWGEFDPAIVQPIVDAHNMKWGRNFKGRSPDPMHFEPNGPWQGAQKGAPMQGDILSMLGYGGAQQAGAPQQAAPQQAARPPEVAPQQQAPAGGGPWTSALADPAFRAALFSMGTQMMVGGHGNMGQQLGVALGKGGQAFSETRAAENEAGLAREQMASRENIAGMQSDSREEVARLRTDAMLERTRMLHGPNNDKEAKWYLDQKLKYYQKEKDNQLLSKKTDAQIAMEAEAWAKQSLEEARRNGLLKGGASEATSTGTGAAAKPGAGGTGAKAPEATSMTLQQMMSDKKHGGKFQQDLRTPEGRERIIKANPELRAQVEDWVARNDVNSGKYMPYDLGQ